MSTERRRELRRQGDRREGDRRADRFGPRIERITESDLRESLTSKTARVEIRCENDVKAEMEAIAQHFGLTVTEYILRLHALAASRLGKLS